MAGVRRRPKLESKLLKSLGDSFLDVGEPGEAASPFEIAPGYAEDISGNQKILD